MNLMDLASRQWSQAALRATASGLDAKLPDIAEAWTPVGTLAPYWQQRYSLPAARVIAWSGDNPCSLVGTGLVREGVVAISLGTSDTIFGIMPTPKPSSDGTGHVFASPTGAYMGMSVFKNGSLARERVRDSYGMDWAAFSHALATTSAGNRGAIMLPWFDPEITPLVLQPGVQALRSRRERWPGQRSGGRRGADDVARTTQPLDGRENFHHLRHRWSVRESRRFAGDGRRL